MSAVTEAVPGPADDEVLVVGAGPTGLLLAGDLAAAGVRVRVLEKRPPAVNNWTRSFSVHPRTMEQLDVRGLAEEVIAGGARLPAMPLFGDLDMDFTTLPTKFPFMLVTPQYNVERALLDRARRMGVRLSYQHEVVSLRQDAEGVELDAYDDSGALTTFTAGYAVGTDGVHSAVRNLLGVAFPGDSVIRSVLIADVRLTRPPSKPLKVDANGHGFAFIAPFGDGWYRVLGWNRLIPAEQDAPADFEELKVLFGRVFGDDHGMYGPRWVSRFHSDERQAESYRVGRVFLAGDAAHVHSPAGGLGMNIGLQDAANLGWKLVSVLRWDAEPELLSTYQDECRPVAEMAMRMSGSLIRAAVAQSGRIRPAQRFMVWLADHLGRLGRIVAARLLMKVSGVGIRYERPSGAHRVVGRHCDDLALAGGAGSGSGSGGAGSLYATLRERRFVLLTADAALASRIGHRDGRLVVRRPADPAGAPARSLLVRPDGYIGWAGDRADPEELDAQLTRWVGPRRSPAPIGGPA
jgi:2-polyprenyl-6-methoxyphenol hydroxylase-like FAD-dependent oxidoreductase